MSVELRSKKSETLPRTYDEFLEWAPDCIRVEWARGEVQFFEPVTRTHQNLVGFLLVILRGYVECGSHGQVFGQLFQMRLHQVDSGREPDIFFVTCGNQTKLTDYYLDGPADLVMEIVDPDTALRDRGEKYAEYEAEGVREYWILDPNTKRADFFVLSPDADTIAAL